MMSRFGSEGHENGTTKSSQSTASKRNWTLSSYLRDVTTPFRQIDSSTCLRHTSCVNAPSTANANFIGQLRTRRGGPTPNAPANYLPTRARNKSSEGVG